MTKTNLMAATVGAMLCFLVFFVVSLADTREWQTTDVSKYALLPSEAATFIHTRCDTTKLKYSPYKSYVVQTTTLVVHQRRFLGYTTHVDTIGQLCMEAPAEK